MEVGTFFAEKQVDLDRGIILLTIGKLFPNFD